jgi:hypothetical protein
MQNLPNLSTLHTRRTEAENGVVLGRMICVLLFQLVLLRLGVEVGANDDRSDTRKKVDVVVVGAGQRHPLWPIEDQRELVKKPVQERLSRRSGNRSNCWLPDVIAGRAQPLPQHVPHAMSEGHAKVLKILENGSESPEELEPKMSSNSPRLMPKQLMENSSEPMVRATS